MEFITLEQLRNKYNLDTITENVEIQFIDIRQPDEYQHEHIESAINIPPEKLNTLSKKDCCHKIAIFYCRSGGRTDVHQSQLQNTPFKEKLCLLGGINEWKKSGLEVVKQTKAPIDVMRQVQFIVAIMILLGVVLGYTVSSYFILLTVFAGLGLLTASITGFCAMATLLKKLPWNK